MWIYENMQRGIRLQPFTIDLFSQEHVIESHTSKFSKKLFETYLFKNSMVCHQKEVIRE